MIHPLYSLSLRYSLQKPYVLWICNAPCHNHLPLHHCHCNRWTDYGIFPCKKTHQCFFSPQLVINADILLVLQMEKIKAILNDLVLISFLSNYTLRIDQRQNSNTGNAFTRCLNYWPMMHVLHAMVLSYIRRVLC